VGAEAAGSVLQTTLGRKLLMQGGSATALHWAINSVKKGGIVSIVGVYGPIDALVPIGNVVNKGITIRANQASVKRLLPRLIEHVQSGVLDPKALITHRIPLEDVSDAYRIFSAKLDECIKPVLMPPSRFQVQRIQLWSLVAPGAGRPSERGGRRPGRPEARPRPQRLRRTGLEGGVATQQVGSLQADSPQSTNSFRRRRLLQTQRCRFVSG
jgi:hypothetical protein